MEYNLLPLSEKKEIEIEKIRLSLISFSKIFFLFFFLLFVSFLSIYFYLEILVDSQENFIEEKRQNFLYKEIQTLNQEINAVNLEINKIYNIQKEFICFSSIVEEIDSLVPENSGMYLTQLGVSSEMETIFLENSLKKDEENKENKEDEKEGEEEERETVQKKFININISGFALKRKNVLELKKLLNDSFMFSDVVSPVENIIPPTNIDFNFTFRLNSN